MEDLGERLRCFRLENGWSKRSVALRLGVSIPSIMRWEAGVAVPNDYNRYKIDRMLESEAGRRERIMLQLSLFPERVPSVGQRVA